MQNSLSKKSWDSTFSETEEVHAWNLSYMPEICPNVQEVDYQWGQALVLINVNVGFKILPWNYLKIQVRWQSKIRFDWCSGILQLVQATNKLKKIYQIQFLVLVYVAGNSIASSNQQAEGIILSNYSPQQVASDK